MQDKKKYGRYAAAIGLLLAALVVPLLGKHVEELLHVVYVSVLLLICGVICLLPKNRRGLWIGGGVIIMLHVLALRYYPGLLLEMLITKAPPYHWASILLGGVGALLCLGFFFAMLVSYLGSDEPVVLRGKIMKIMILVGWPLFAVSACFPKLKYELTNMTARSQSAYPILLALVFAWAQYALFHWLLFMTITWIRDAVKKKKEQRRVPQAQ